LTLTCTRLDSTIEVVSATAALLARWVVRLN